MTPETSTMQFGRYEILDELGRGAMGVVYMARDPVIGRLLALKTLRLLDMGDAEETAQFRRRFIREAQSAGILSHPHIVTIHDVVDEGETGPTFIAMEYIEGTDLKTLIQKDSRLGLDFITDVIRQVAEGLDYAHSKGVVHRDVKPANVLLTQDGRVKITDFGIARLDTSSLTLDHELLGTPNYMAPEQILGSEADHRMDVFALGVLIYELLTGSKPFKGDNLTAVTHRIVYEDHTPVLEHASHLPAQIEAVIAKALAKDPKERYESCGELARELARCLESYDESASLHQTQRLTLTPPPPPAAPATLGERLRAGWKGLGATAGGTVAGATITGTGSAEPAPWSRATLLGRPPLLRALAVAGVAAVLAVFIGLILLNRAESPGGETLVAGDYERQRQYANLLREGRLLLDQGDPSGALLLLQQAERLSPEREEAEELLARAESEVESLDSRSQQISDHLASAREFFSNNQPRRAMKAVEEALALDPDHEAANDLYQAAQMLAARSGLSETPAQARAPDAAEVAEMPTDAEADGTAPSRPARPRTGPVTLVASFVSYYQREPVGTVTMLWNGATLFQGDFRFLEKKGVLGLGGRETYNGRLDFNNPITVQPGAGAVQIYVTPKGEKAHSTFLNVDLAPGENRELAVFWSKDGDLTARMD